MSHELSSNSQLRYCIQRIELKPIKKVKNKICARLLVDEEVAHDLPSIKKGQPLIWEGPLYCNANPNASISFQIYQENYLGLKLVLKCSIRLPVTEIAGALSVQTQTIERTSDAFSVLFKFFDPTLLSPRNTIVRRNAIIRRGATLRRSAVLDFESIASDGHSIGQRVGVSRSAIDGQHRYHAAFKTILDFAEVVSEVSPTLAGPILAACRIASQELKDWIAYETVIEELVFGFADILGTTRPVFGQGLPSTNLKLTTASILELIQKTSEFIMEYTSVINTGQMTNAFVSASQDRTENMIKQLRRLKEEFDQQLAERAHLDWLNRALEKLKPVGHSTHHETAKCLPGTRITVINDIDRWIKQDLGSDRLLWMHGPSGFGKSSVAASVCESLENHNMLAASFFCKWDDPELREAESVMNTIIDSLARNHSRYKELVAAAIHNDPSLNFSSPGILYERLVRLPLMTLAHLEPQPETMCIMVDALDECGTKESRSELLSYLLGMSQVVPWLKVVVMSCPSQEIIDFFDKTPGNSTKQMDMCTHDSSADIHVFIRERMAPKLNSSCRFTDSTVSMLAERAGGLFIWAEIACRLISDGPDPHKRLEEVLEKSATAPATDTLYSIILENARRYVEDDMLKQCLGIVIATGLRTPLPVNSLERLLGGYLDLDVLNLLLNSLSPVLYEDQSEHRQGAVRAYHRSFPDYITIRSRSKDFWVDLGNWDVMLSSCCLTTMLTELKFNICELETSYVLNRDVPNLQSRLSSSIEPHLRYSCQYWITHVTAIDPMYLDVALLKSILFGPILFYWIEALSLLNKLDVALLMLPMSTNWKYLKNSDFAELSAGALDAYRFVVTFYKVISESAPHLYLSALPFAPTQSGIAERGRKWFPNTLRLMEGSVRHWPPRTMPHSSTISCLALSPDGSMVALGYQDKTVQLWDVATSTQVRGPLVGHLDNIWSVVFSPSGRRIASGSHDSTVVVWDVQTGAKVLEPLVGHSGPVLSVVYFPDGRHIVSGSHDKTIRIWDTETGAEVYAPLTGHSGPVLSVASSPDGLHIASGSFDKTVRIWVADTGASILLVGHSGWVRSVAFSPDGRSIVSGSSDKTIQAWDSQTGEKLLPPIVGHAGSVNSVSFSHNGECIASGSDDKSVQIWNAHTGAKVYAPPIVHSDCVRYVAFSPDGLHIVSSSNDKTMWTWRAGASAPASTSPVGHSGGILSVAFSPDGRHIVSSSNDGSACMRDVEIGGATSIQLVSHSGAVLSVAISPDGRYIALGSVDNTVSRWDAKTGGLSSPLVGHSDSVWSVAFSPDSRRIVSGSGDKTVRIWDTETGTPVSEPLIGHSDSVFSVAFSPNCRFIVSGSGDRTVRMWNVETGAPTSASPFVHPSYVFSVTWSPDGQRVVSGSSDNTVRIWDVDTGTIFKSLFGHSSSVWSVAFSPDGRHIISGSRDSTVRVWDAETGASLSSLIGHSDSVWSVAFSPDGGRIASASNDGTIRIWAMNSNPNFDASPYPTNVSHLSRFTQPSGWVSLDNKPHLLWIPNEFQRPSAAAEVDDSLICIHDILTHTSSRVMIDFSRFVHGTSWASVADV